MLLFSQPHEFFSLKDLELKRTQADGQKHHQKNGRR
jgi:hypothetical protein